jgi:hypothetical protein
MPFSVFGFRFSVKGQISINYQAHEEWFRKVPKEKRDRPVDGPDATASRIHFDALLPSLRSAAVKT